MLFFAKTGVSENKRLDKALLSIFGVGKQTAKNACLQYGLLGSATGGDLRLRPLKLPPFKAHFDDYPLNLGDDLKQNYKTYCQRLIDIRSYRGRRHKGGYPVRGQRTHTNAKTQKRLYKRWLINAYEKPKVVLNIKKLKQGANIKAKKTKVIKPKSSNKPKATKVNKYKI